MLNATELHDTVSPPNTCKTFEDHLLLAYLLCAAFLLHAMITTPAPRPCEPHHDLVSAVGGPPPSPRRIASSSAQSAPASSSRGGSGDHEIHSSSWHVGMCLTKLGERRRGTHSGRLSQRGRHDRANGRVGGTAFFRSPAVDVALAGRRCLDATCAQVHDVGARG